MRRTQARLKMFPGILAPLLALTIVALISNVLLSAAPQPKPGKPSAEDIFASTNLLRLSIEIPDEGMQTLRQPRPRRGNQSKPKAQATITEGGRTYTNVTVQLKGFTTYQPIDGLPSLTLNFDSFAPKQRFYGFRKISLNNSLQDPTRLHEKFAREMFAAANVPTPRADFAVVTLNGHELGLYVLAEGFDKDFLKRQFGRSDGTLYEGGVLQDIDRPLQIVSGKSPTNSEAIQKLIDAAHEPDPTARWRSLNAALDMDRFLSMVAIETMLCHSDSYSMNRNNYRIYHDPLTEKLVFIPHGMDRILGTHRSNLDLSLVPPMLGLVARAVVSTAEGRARYVERAGVLLTNLFDEGKLCDRVRAMDSRILGEKLRLPADHRFDSTPNHQHDADSLCERISTRIADLKLQMSQATNIAALPFSPVFDTNGIARIDGWKPRPLRDQPEVRCELKTVDGKPVLSLRATKAPLSVSLRTRISVPAGNFEFSGRISVTNTAGATNSVSMRLERGAGTRFAIERQRLDWRSVRLNLQVAEARAPEEIELVCDILSSSEEISFDSSSLFLIGAGK